MRVAILQPSYLPWLGYFEQIARSDSFVFLDDVQYTRSDWRNRNRIKTPRGPAWITVPVRRLGLKQRISDALIDYKSDWPEHHLNQLRENYRKAPYFEAVMALLEPRLRARPERLVDLNVPIVHDLMAFMGLATPTQLSSLMGVECDDPNGRLIEICTRLGATEMYEGAAGRDYFDVARFQAAGIAVRFQEYQHPVYDQFFPPFVSHLSAVDLLFHHGGASREILAA